MFTVCLLCVYCVLTVCLLCVYCVFTECLLCDYRNFPLSWRALWHARISSWAPAVAWAIGSLYFGLTLGALYVCIGGNPGLFGRTILIVTGTLDFSGPLYICNGGKPVLV